MPAPAEYYLQRQRLAPSQAETADWDAVPTWVRERAFFMAAVDRGDILAKFREQATAMAAGTVSLAQARETMRRYLDASGYDPGDDAGTIKDLSTLLRRDVALTTNTGQAQGWAQRKQFLGDVTHPGLMLYRAQQRREKRNWVARCSQFAGRDDVVLTGDMDAPMIALSNSPVWAELSRFGTPYPPFDFNSGMWVKPVPYDDCVRYGLIDDANEDEMMSRVLEVEPESLNADLSSTRAEWDESTRNQASRELGGLARWEGDDLVFADPNGTRPYDSRAIAQIITAPLPAGIPQRQADALRRYKSAPASMSAAESADLARLFGRIEPTNTTMTGPLYRGTAMSDVELDAIRRDGYRAAPGKPGDSWSLTRQTAEPYARVDRDSGDEWLRSVLLVAKSAAAVHVITDAVRAVTGSDNEPDEVVTLPGQRFRVVGESETPRGPLTLYLEEVPHAS